MKILVVNDDGVFAPGILALATKLQDKYDVTVVAPNVERSGHSQAITLFKQMRLREVSLEGFHGKAYSLEGTPADCVRVAMEYDLARDADIVLSGINLGYNAGMDILYSGTVSAAIEANVYEKPSIAISSKWEDGTAMFDTAAEVAEELLEKTKDKLLEDTMLLNVNVPYLKKEELKGIEVCPVGDVIYDQYQGSENGDGHDVALIGRHPKELSKYNDRYYLKEGYATVTPLIYDLTNYDLLQTVKKWI